MANNTKCNTEITDDIAKQPLDPFSFPVLSNTLVNDAADNSRDGRLVVERMRGIISFSSFRLAPKFVVPKV